MTRKRWTLVATPLSSLRRAAIWWAAGLAALIVVTVAFWPAFRGSSGISEAIGQLPTGIVQAFGLEDFGTPAGFLRGNLYEFFVPLLLAVAVVAFVNGQTAADETNGRSRGCSSHSRWTEVPCTWDGRSGHSWHWR